MINLTDVQTYLREAPQNWGCRDSAPFAEALADMKAHAVSDGDQALAATLWCHEQTLDIQDSYISAYQHLCSHAHYQAWCLFERVEITYWHLKPHFGASENEFHLPFIWDHASRFQSLFPYCVFCSPEFVVREAKCSICGAVLSPRNLCGHDSGQIYDGEFCGRIITGVDMIGVSLVTEPVQKYSVVFLVDPATGQSYDHYRYDVVDYLVQGLTSPFHGWNVIRTKRRHPHDRYGHVTPNSRCPCESGLDYKDCCLDKPGVLRPHLEFYFEVPPPVEMPLTYTD